MKTVGLWIDHRKAVIVFVVDKKIVKREISWDISTFTTMR
jgi:hypothetical protein